jgi:osmoprotectant transport system permease protein
MGMRGLQKFVRVELPLASPLIVSGIRLALVQVWATATIAALVAGPGLGNVITAGFFNGDYPRGLAGALVVAAVALLLELLSAWVQRAVQARARPDTRGAKPRDTEGVDDEASKDPGSGTGRNAGDDRRVVRG